MMLDRIRSQVSAGAIWGPIDDELMRPREMGLFRGRVLNSGAGWRDLSHLIEGELVNQDLRYPDEQRTNIQIFAPAHEVPVDAGTFDTVLSIAVLEHVQNPIEVVKEYFRVLKPGGHVVASIPFMQPFHAVPYDYQRWSHEGLLVLFKDAGFEVDSIEPIFTLYHTLHWLVYEASMVRNSFSSKLARYIFLPPLLWMSKRSKLNSPKLTSVFQVIATKPGPTR